MVEQLTSQEIIEGIEKLSSGKIKMREDFERLIINAVESGRMSDLEDLAFQAKFITGLIKIIKTNDKMSDEMFALKLNDEFRVAYIRIQNLIRVIVSGSSKFIQDIFEEKYLHLSQESLSNLSNLCGDIAYLKLYLNDLKIKKDQK
jgi:hypothetical protein